MHRALIPGIFLLALPAAAAHPGHSAEPARPAALADTSAIRAAVRLAERQTGGRIGVHVRHLESGATFSARGGDPFFMGSVAKLPLAIHVLRQVERGRIRLDDTVRLDSARMLPQPSSAWRARVSPGSRVTVEELLQAAISDSDNTAANELLHLVGGPDSVTAGLRQMGLRAVRLDRDYTGLRTPASATDTRDTSTPAGATEMLVALWKGRLLGAEETRRLIGWMTETRNPAGRILAGVPQGTVVAHKTGTWTGQGAHPVAALNDVGVITLRDGGHLAVAIFLRDARTETRPSEAAIAQITRAIYAHWTGIR